MTDNDSMRLLGKSPMETAAALAWLFGREKAAKLAQFQVRELASFTRVFGAPLEFWATVAHRLTGQFGVEMLAPGPFQLAQFHAIAARAACKGVV